MRYDIPSINNNLIINFQMLIALHTHTHTPHIYIVKPYSDTCTMARHVCQKSFRRLIDVDVGSLTSIRRLIDVDVGSLMSIRRLIDVDVYGAPCVSKVVSSAH